MTETITKGRLFKEDLNFATGGSGAVETATQVRQAGDADLTFTLTKLDGTHLKYRTAQDAAAKSMEDLVDGGRDVHIMPKTISLSATMAAARTAGTGEVQAVDVVTKSPWVDVRAYGAVGALATLTAAIAGISSDSATLLIPSGTWAITDDLTIPANIVLKPVKGAILQIATTKTLTINGPLDAGPYQIFSCTGTGKVVFAAGAVDQIHPEWWAANTTPGTTDMTAAILAAYTAARDVDRGIVRLLANQYAVADLVLPQCTNGDGVMIAGAGPNNTKIVVASGHTAGNPLVTLAGTHAAATDGIYLRDFQVYGAGGDTNGILIQPSNNCRVEDVTVLSCSGIGFEAQRPYDLYCTRLRVYGCGKYADSEPGVRLGKVTEGMVDYWGNQVYWNQCNVEMNYYRQMEIKGISGMDAHGGKIHGIPTTGTSPDEALNLLYIDGMSGWGKFIGVHFTHAHYANAVHITDDHGLTPGVEAYSVASFIGCDFLEISSYNTALLSIDAIYFDAGDVESALRVQGCRFGYHSSGLGATGYYIHISANAGAWDTNIGGNQVREKVKELQDDRTSVTRAGGFRAPGVIPDVLSLGTDQDPELTIASGAVTLTSSFHYIDTESDGATDDLVTVNGLTRRGTVVVIRAIHTDRTVVIKNTGGNIKCNGGADITLDSTDKMAILINMNGTTWWAIGG